MASIMHKIKAYLYENLLTDDPNDYVARVSSERTLDISSICSSAANRGGADVSAATMEHSVKLFFKETKYQLYDGYSINVGGYFTASPVIKGVFNSPTETFNTDKHSIGFQFIQGDALRSDLSSIEVDILGVADSSISISQVTDVKTNSVNDKLTPNRNLKIKGYKVKLAGDNATVGVYFVNQTTGERTKVDSTDMVNNNPSELVIVIPELVAGTYKVEVTSQFSGAVLLKEPRTATFDKTLTVQ